MNESLSISQTQQTVQRLSPRQVQYARLLEMTAPEVEEEVRRQLDDNPALEVDESVTGDDMHASQEDAADGYSAESPASAAEYDEPLSDSDDDPADRRYSYASADPQQWQLEAEAPDLGALLETQIEQSVISDDIKKIALYIIGNIDENGYLTRTLVAMADDIAITTGQEATMAQMREAFEAVRELDPAGVGAVDLRDCLLLQLGRKSPSSLPLKIAKEIVGHYFDLFSKKHFDRMAAQLGLDEGDEELAAAYDIIRSLNPKPGSAVSPSASTMRQAQITPDVIVEAAPDGRFTVYLASRLPRLQIERSFSADIAPDQPLTKGQKEAQAFIRLKRDDAEAFISALNLRGNTLIDVAQAIVKRQREFFLTGDKSKLKPLILKDISADTGLDLSVISRATAGKFIATELGTYPMKMFFNEAPSDASDTSSHELMHALRIIIEEEDKKKPLTDQALLEAMQAKGYKLARRTVTKYREKMGIPVGRLRKKL